MTTVEKDIIRPGERRELKALVRLRVKVLRAEVEQKHMEMLAEIDGQVATKFQEDDARLDEFRKKLDAVTAAANNKITKIFAEFSDITEPRGSAFNRPWFHKRDTGRVKLRQALIAAVHAQTHVARHQVTKLEAELLSTLSLDAVHSEAAKEFVKLIPVVEDLLSSRTLAEVEAGFEDES
jgi:hypothetical protein